MKDLELIVMGLGMITGIALAVLILTQSIKDMLFITFLAVLGLSFITMALILITIILLTFLTYWFQRGWAKK